MGGFVGREGEERCCEWKARRENEGLLTGIGVSG